MNSCTSQTQAVLFLKADFIGPRQQPCKNSGLQKSFFSFFLIEAKHSAPAGNSAVTTDNRVLCTQTLETMRAVSVVVSKRVAGNRR